VVGDGVVWGSASFVVRTLEDGRIAGVGMGLEA
jgi:NhaP-type Na+/H+ and K+/H+ antiporter